MTSPRYQSAAPSSKMRDCFLTIIKSCLPHLRVRTFHLAPDGQGRGGPGRAGARLTEEDAGWSEDERNPPSTNANVS